ncbi:uncharacterized protein FA14DRAFT_183877 [Meira miltonrushii]|uniref:Uncharacterized protein n=1 Tax=Meira miltonrushii TaxID=1280837 RepID=A0A316VLQ2_9BASI|nr:uncharacterized protein FA14DRAFT_183877 [Meira miltonrushii]PWN38522.1 hypothetical protein FA14DRAFT_183877 [Meira miltonrushii]
MQLCKSVLLYTILCIAILFSELSCLSHSKESDLNDPNLAKRQTDQSPTSSSGSTGHPHSLLEQYKKSKSSTSPLSSSSSSSSTVLTGSPPSLSEQNKKRKWSTTSLSETDRNALKAAEAFLNDDHMSLEQALKKHMTKREPKLFTNEVLHRSKVHGRPAGYESVKQTAARHAESVLRSGKHTEEEARKIGQAMVDRKNQRRVDRRAYWINMANTDPSQVRHQHENVPLRLSKHHYVALRSHQLDYQGKAENMHVAKKMAEEETEKAHARKSDRERNRRAKLKQKRLGQS